MKTIAFAPSHITGFFEICYHDDYKKAGSRGAGINISLGSYAEVGKKGNSIFLEGNIGKGEVTLKALQNLGLAGINVKIKNELPLSQGFGVSASSTLATLLAVCHMFNLPEKKAVEASHLAEVEMKTGLGDVVASYIGGIEIRKEPGIEGKIEKIECRKKLIVAIVGKKIETKNILKNEKMVERINDTGKVCLKEFLKDKSLENFFDLSLKFSFETGIADKNMQRILNEANKVGKATMCMLGNAIIAIYSKEMKKFLSSYQHYECFIDNEGARILATFFP
ncbi:MAG: GHMP kinase [Thermoplasmata archaeon]|nr:MAG: GHMP kinase [Thermoplasmata archaeon]